MSHDRLPTQNARPAEDLATSPDRRRPGRLPITNPHLIALLRGGPLPAPELDLPPPPALTRPARADDLAPARGILAATGASIVLWICIAGGIALALGVDPHL